MPPKDYYAMLGVTRNASPLQIKRAYRRLARLYHPDLNQKAPEDRIKQINEAYDVLGDAAKKALYDIQLLEEMRHELIMEALRRPQEHTPQEPRMTWPQGFYGFFHELRRNMREE
jgi:curved DNA-binding protein CbpA